MNQTTGLSEYIVIWNKIHRIYCIVNRHSVNESFQSVFHSNILSYWSKTSLIIGVVPGHYRKEQFTRISNISLNVLHLVRPSLMNVMWLKMNQFDALQILAGTPCRTLRGACLELWPLPNHHWRIEHCMMLQLRPSSQVHIPSSFWYPCCEFRLMSRVWLVFKKYFWRMVYLIFYENILSII